MKSRIATTSNVTMHTLISPRGKVYQTDNLSKFARRFNLDRTALSKMIHGKRVSHKNWTVA